MPFLRAVSEQIQIVKIKSVESANLSRCILRAVDMDECMLCRLHGHAKLFTINCNDLIIICIDPFSDSFEFLILAKPV